MKKNFVLKYAKWIDLCFKHLSIAFWKLKFSETWNKNAHQIVLNLKICDHCREQIRLDKHFPTFWASWAKVLTFQIVWFWNKTWLRTITLWCSWKIQIFWKSSKWYAFLKNWIIGNLVYIKTYHTQNPFQVLDHDYTRLPFSFPIDIQGHITQKPNFSLPQVCPIWLILFDWGNLNHFGPRVPR